MKVWIVVWFNIDRLGFVVKVGVVVKIVVRWKAVWFVKECWVLDQNIKYIKMCIFNFDQEKWDI